MLSLIFPHDPHHEGVVLDNNYEVYKTVDLRGELGDSNMHDFVVIEDGANALTLSHVKGPATVEQSKAIGFDGECRAAWKGFKEVRVDDGEVLFDWSARDWIGLDECTFIKGSVEKRCTGAPWDILHLNSIDKFPDGDYLVSSRHTDAIYRVSHEDGHIVWRLGGTKTDFEMEDSAIFSRQHHARVHGENETHTVISVFDNAHGDGPSEAEHPTNSLSRGLLFALRTDTKPMTAVLAAHYDHPQRGISNSRGSMYVPAGHSLLFVTIAYECFYHVGNFSRTRTSSWDGLINLVNLNMHQTESFLWKPASERALHTRIAISVRVIVELTPRSQ
jgi:hypothetical protein